MTRPAILAPGETEQANRVPFETLFREQTEDDRRLPPAPIDSMANNRWWAQRIKRPLVKPEWWVKMIASKPAKRPETRHYRPRQDRSTFRASWPGQQSMGDPYLAARGKLPRLPGPADPVDWDLWWAGLVTGMGPGRGASSRTPEALHLMLRHREPPRVHRQGPGPGFQSGERAETVERLGPVVFDPDYQAPQQGSPCRPPVRTARRGRRSKIKALLVKGGVELPGQRLASPGYTDTWVMGPAKPPAWLEDAPLWVQDWWRDRREGKPLEETIGGRCPPGGPGQDEESTETAPEDQSLPREPGKVVPEVNRRMPAPVPLEHRGGDLRAVQDHWTDFHERPLSHEFRPPSASFRRAYLAPDPDDLPPMKWPLSAYTAGMVHRFFVENDWGLSPWPPHNVTPRRGSEGALAEAKERLDDRRISRPPGCRVGIDSLDELMAEAWIFVNGLDTAGAEDPARLESRALGNYLRDVLRRARARREVFDVVLMLQLTPKDEAEELDYGWYERAEILGDDDFEDEGVHGFDPVFRLSGTDMARRGWRWETIEGGLRVRVDRKGGREGRPFFQGGYLFGPGNWFESELRREAGLWDAIQRVFAGQRAIVPGVWAAAGTILGGVETLFQRYRRRLKEILRERYWPGPPREPREGDLVCTGRSDRNRGQVMELSEARKTLRRPITSYTGRTRHGHRWDRHIDLEWWKSWERVQ